MFALTCLVLVVVYFSEIRWFSGLGGFSRPLEVLSVGGVAVTDDGGIVAQCRHRSHVLQSRGPMLGNIIESLNGSNWRVRDTLDGVPRGECA